MNRTTENCSFAKNREREGLGRPEVQNDGKCLGYSGRSNDDEPCYMCKVCPLSTVYEKE